MGPVPKQAKRLYDIMEHRQRYASARKRVDLAALKIMFTLEQEYGPDITHSWLNCVTIH